MDSVLDRKNKFYFDSKELSYSELELLLPEFVSKIASNDAMEIITFQAYEKESEKLAGVCVFSLMEYPLKELSFEYIYTEEAFKGLGLSKDLFEYSTNQLKKYGTQSINCRIFAGIDSIRDYFLYLQKLGFSLLKADGIFIKYRLSDLQYSQTIQTICAAKVRLPKLIQIGEYKDIRIKRFLFNNDNTGFYFAEDVFDPKLSWFYVDEGKISAAIIAKAKEPNILFVSAIYQDREAKAKNLFLPLLVSAIASGNQELGDDMEIWIQMDDQKMMDGLRQVFNPPDEGHLVLECAYLWEN